MAARYKVGDWVKAKDKSQSFFRAQVRKVEKRTAKGSVQKIWRYLCHYEGWNVRYDAWLAAEDLRVITGDTEEEEVEESEEESEDESEEEEDSEEDSENSEPEDSESEEAPPPRSRRSMGLASKPRAGSRASSRISTTSLAASASSSSKRAGRGQPAPAAKRAKPAAKAPTNSSTVCSAGRP